ncbi:MAG: AmmeMemoRadiSam system protein B [Deltaproteobacteria bacterium]|nr:AmmeMemoRadiSam system protein B [Deltaproteobacteria bacterium]MBW2140897.1 AmmeMemoRadiSam system protein B [Deltaproteobacteria bacterium]
MISESDDGLKGGNRKPVLRPVEAFPVEIQGQKAICLRDPNRIAPQSLFLKSNAALVLSLLDGAHDLRDIQAEWMRRFSQLIPLENIKGLIEQLDKHLFLEGESFDRFFGELKAAFSALTTRPAMLAGQSYAAEPEALEKQLEAYYHHPSGPNVQPCPEGSPRGLVAPHIDFIRGGPCYAWTYNLLKGSKPPGLVVILGTAHGPTENYLVVCDKDFETPFGTLKCEKELAGEMLNKAGPIFETDGFVHRGEHSIEFQTVWLKSLFREAEEIYILPVLCGSFHKLMEAGLQPEDLEAYRNALHVLKDLLAEWEKSNGKAMILASVDLSHVGPQFGDDFTITNSVRSRIREYDLDLLNSVTEGDFQGFYRKVAQENDRNHVCGVAPLYTSLRLLGGVKGRLLSYDQWVDANGQGLVSFASLAFP